ncbi:hypothetical protein Pgy4_23463, partial [Pseudomonas savastanoi pv. glycinea str. race 4]
MVSLNVLLNYWGTTNKQLAGHLQQLPERINADNQQISLLDKALSDLADATLQDTAGVVARV